MVGFAKKTEFVIARPVVDGIEDFTSVLEVSSFGIFGNTPENGVFIPVAKGSNEHRRVAKKRFDCYRNLVLPLVELCTPMDSQGSSTFHYAAQRLQDGRRQGHDTSDQPISDQLSRVGLAYDIAPGQSIPMYSKAIALREPLQTPGLEVVLLPDDNLRELFVEENVVIMKALKRLGRVRDRVDLSAPYEPVIPLGQLPADAQPHEISALLSALEPHLPVRMTLGAVLPPRVQ